MPNRKRGTRRSGMIGVITTRDILVHPIITIRCFGWQVFFRALFVGHKQTFLSLLPQVGTAKETASRLSTLIDRCVDLELRAKGIYVAFARTFADRPEAGRFFDALAQQEQSHADLLMLCKAAARQAGWMAECHNPWEDYLPCLEQQMQDVETALRDVGSLEDALRLVVQIESGEVNRVFQGVLATSAPTLAKKLTAFREAMESHIDYIVVRLPELAPRFTLATRELRALFPPVR
jgi:hypothetical protein